ncbi:MAG TPA: nucleotidyl transferase AbiEii/AbiGii toxin family protein [Methanocorpusculum sp.]|nr:nucleotidyl transferase AbiEii/AbiGii toxin family protein [Methanocorpusculum sp.]
MKNIAKRPAEDREALFRNTAEKMGINEAIIEKDFWVCWTLDHLFHDCPWKNNLTFKGGTSLSKAYGLIDRFSEDIDLILDWCILDYDKDEPWMVRSKNQQDHFNKEADHRAEDFLKDIFLPQIQNDLSEKLGSSVHMGILHDNKQTITFQYPNSFSDGSILQEIRLEIGPLAACSPSGWQTIQPYSAEKYSHLFEQKSTDVLTVHPERTFWEKVLILHSVANLPDEKKVPLRYSRHYYDVVKMGDSDVKIKAFADLDLLEMVKKFKMKFYPLSWANYEQISVGDIHLLPSERHMAELKSDYFSMQSMIYGDTLSFEDLLEKLGKLQDEIQELLKT